MSKAYGTSNKSTGRTAGINNHPGSDPKGASDEPFSAMAMVDAKEHHVKTISNMSAQPGHVKSMNIDHDHAYAKQSHAVRPSGPIESFVGSKVDSGYKEKTKVLKPHGEMGKYDGKKQN